MSEDISNLLFLMFNDIYNFFSIFHFMVIYSLHSCDNSLNTNKKNTTNYHYPLHLISVIHTLRFIYQIAMIYLLTNSLFFKINNTSNTFLSTVCENEYHIMQLTSLQPCMNQHKAHTIINTHEQIIFQLIK